MSQELILTSRLNRMIEQQYLKQMVSIFKYTYNYTHACIHSLYPSLHPFSPPCHTHTHTHTHTHAGRHKNINTHFLCCKRQLQSAHTHSASLPNHTHACPLTNLTILHRHTYVCTLELQAGARRATRVYGRSRRRWGCEKWVAESHAPCSWSCLFAHCPSHRWGPPLACDSLPPLRRESATHTLTVTICVIHPHRKLKLLFDPIH